MVVDVALLLDLRRYQTIAVGAAQQAAAKREFMMPLFWPIVGGKDVLYPLEYRWIDKQRVCSFVGRFAPPVEADVKRILQNLVQISLGINPTGFHSNLSSQFSNGEITFREQLENPLHNRCRIRIDFDGVLGFVVLVSQWRTRRVNPLNGFLPHSLADFLAQVLDVIAGEHDLDAVDEPVM